MLPEFPVLELILIIVNCPIRAQSRVKGISSVHRLNHFYCGNLNFISWGEGDDRRDEDYRERRGCRCLILQHQPWWINIDPFDPNLLANLQRASCSLVAGSKAFVGVTMIGSFICRVLILAFGHVYPAYKCYKSVELNKPEIEQLRFWCQYWILVAFLSVLGAFADVFFSWLPLYYEAKLVVYLFLWYPQTNGATIVYEKYVGPYIAEHEHEIDLTLLEFRARASDNALIAQQLVASYLKTSLSEMVKYALLMLPAQKLDSFQSQQLQQPAQPQEPQPPSVMPPAHQPAASQPPQSEARALFNPIESSEPQEQPIKEGISLQASPALSQETVPETDSLQTAQVPTPTEEPIEVETSSSEAVQNSDQQLEATPIEEAARHVERDNLRKRVPIATISPADP